MPTVLYFEADTCTPSELIIKTLQLSDSWSSVTLREFFSAPIFHFSDGGPKEKKARK